VGGVGEATNATGLPTAARRSTQRFGNLTFEISFVHSCFHWFKSATVFTTLDLNSAYHQIGLTEGSKPLTAFATDWNLYEGSLWNSYGCPGPHSFVRPGFFPMSNIDLFFITLTI
jgi:hypothetical protein